MKIRRYMLNLVEQSGENSIQVPSIIELSKKFNVSRPTVSKAMKMLTADGFIIGRRGVGAFTNPAKAQHYACKPHYIVNIMIGDGMMAYYTPYFLEQLGRILLVFARLHFDVSFVQLTSHQEERVIDEISMNSFSSLLWLMPSRDMQPVIRTLRNNGKHVIVIGTGYDEDICNLYFDYYHFGYEVGRKLLQEGRRKVAYLLNTPGWSQPLRGLQQAYDDAGITLNPELFLSKTPDFVNNLRKLLCSPGKVDALFSSVYPTSVFKPLYDQLPLRARKEIRFVIEEDFPPIRFSGWFFRQPYPKLEAEILRIFEQEANGVRMDQCKIPIQIDLTEIHTGDKNDE